MSNLQLSTVNISISITAFCQSIFHSILVKHWGNSETRFWDGYCNSILIWLQLISKLEAGNLMQWKYVGVGSIDKIIPYHGISIINIVVLLNTY